MNPVFRLFYVLYRAGAALKHWSRRRFTKAGLFVAGGFLVSGSVGTDVENTVVYEAFALLLGLLLLALAGSWFFRGEFSITRSLPRFGTAGERLRYRVRVTNRGRRIQKDLTLLENLVDPRPSFKEWIGFQRAEGRGRWFRTKPLRRKHPFRMAWVKEAAMPALAANGEGETEVELLPYRRGILRLTGTTLARSDPMGLFRSFVHVKAPQTVSILPRRYPLGAVALPGTMKYQEGGVAQASNVGRSDEFVSLRDYRRGDPVRYIHWRSWAKAGKPIVKEFEDEFFVRHALVLDTFTDNPRSELLEEAISVAASFACEVVTQESLLDLLFVGAQSYCFTAGRSLGGTEQMLEILAAVGGCTRGSFVALEELVLRHIGAVSGCICVLLDWDGPRQQLVRKLMEIGVPTLVLVVTDGAGKKPEPGPMREAPERFWVLDVGQIGEQLAALK
ncbi:MAG: DUF58 domain-containing protein [Verrucomicrobiota bacterium]|nr:DUF58 domain-containing protein [Verrucomicrobiota bacterium]